MAGDATESSMVPVEIYTANFCSYCVWAKELLQRKGVKFTEIDVSGNRELRAAMTARANGKSTVPQIFIGQTHVGGCDELYALDEVGGLDPLLGLANG
jgi:glutaredoxin 3